METSAIRIGKGRRRIQSINIQFGFNVGGIFLAKNVHVIELKKISSGWNLRNFAYDSTQCIMSMIRFPCFLFDSTLNPPFNKHCSSVVICEVFQEQTVEVVQQTSDMNNYCHVESFTRQFSIKWIKMSFNFQSLRAGNLIHFFKLNVHSHDLMHKTLSNLKLMNDKRACWHTRVEHFITTAAFNSSK